MKTRSFALCGLALATLASTSLSAEPMSCPQVRAMAEMTRVNSTAELQALRMPAGNGYLARLVFAFREFQLHPSTVTASAVLGFLPQDDSHREDWYSLSGFICDQEDMADITALAKFQDRMSHEFAQAVLIVPEKMFEYVSYPVILGLDPHDDYAEQMEAVCRARPNSFNAAVNKLSDKDKAWFLKIVFDLQGCHALYHPEAE